MKRYKLEDANGVRADSRGPEYSLLELVWEADFDSEEFDQVSELKVGDRLKLDDGPIIIRVS